MANSLLDDILDKFDGLDVKTQEEMIQSVSEATKDRIWTPLSGAQTEAYFSEADELFYGGSAGGGKGLLLDELVLTPTGWEEIGNLQEGDVICGTDGTHQTITGYFKRGKQPTYNLNWHDGTETTCDGDHLWHSWKAGAGQKSAHKRSTNDIVEYYQDKNHRRIGIPVISEPIYFDKKDSNIPIDPYLLGVLIGDGSLRHDKVCFTNPDNEIAERIRRDTNITLNEHDYEDRCIEYGIPLGEIRDDLRELELLNKKSYNKFIPKQYLFTNVESRLCLLQGLMDTDGWSEEDGDCYYGTSSKELSEDVRHLARSLGAIVTTRSKMPKYKYKGEIKEGKLAYTLRIKIPNPSILFSLDRKRDRCKARTQQSMAIWLDSIEFNGFVDTVCIAVSNPNHLFIINNFIVTHNTDLGIGLALQEHERSLFMRRERETVKDAFDRVEEILDTTDGRNGSDLLWKVTIADLERNVKFGGCKDEKDKQKYKGRPRDLYVFDEISDFLKSQYMFIKTWNRSTREGQRCRVLCTGNPPTTAEGLWVIEYWGAWLDPKHPNPAEEGELRWYTTDRDGVEHEVDGKKHTFYYEDGTEETISARSRTFIRAGLSDNPYLANTDYGATLDSLPIEIRNAYRDGRFDVALEDDPWQVIPTQWIIEAQERWRNVYNGKPPKNVPMCAIGVDIAQGGADNTVLAPRYDGFYTELTKVAGKDTPNGKSVVAEIVKVRKDGALPVLDMGGGFGGATSEKLEENQIKHHKYKGATECKKISRCKNFSFNNTRSYSYWMFREALDPEQQGGSDICLPDDKRLVADLTSLTYSIARDTGGKMKVSLISKDLIKKKLGRSPDEGDAVIMGWSAGDKACSHSQVWRKNNNAIPSVKIGYNNRRRK